MIALLIQHPREIEAKPAHSDLLTPPNNLGIFDSNRTKQAESDITTLRMVEMDAAEKSTQKDNRHG